MNKRKTMEIIAPTNWDLRLIQEFEKYKVREVYGKLAIDAVGGGRVSYCLPHVGKRRLVRYIGALHNSGINFNYLLNSSCLGFKEFTRSGRRQIDALLKWLVEAQVDQVTVSIPFLAQVIKNNYPSLKICVSTFAMVDSLEKALFWQSLGAESITLPHTCLNRDFDRLKLIRKNVKCRLRLIATAGCLYHCPLFLYHSLWDSHGSQKENSGKAGFSVNYCALYCNWLRLQEPGRFIRSQWIRPEDIGLYEEIGIDGIKLTDRRCSTEKITEIIKSYSQRSYDGNLLNILPLFHGKSALTKENFFTKFRYFFHPGETKIFNIFKLNKLIRDFNIYIDNKKLNGFISDLLKRNCSNRNCSDCRYCDQIAKDVVKYDVKYLEQLKKDYKEFLDNFINIGC